MKKYNKQLLLFKDISGKKIEADFNGDEVSSDAGILFLREAEREVGLIRRIGEVLRDRRHPGYVKHQFIQLLKQRVFQIICGYEDGDDSDELRHDPVLKMTCERLPDENDLPPNIGPDIMLKFCWRKGVRNGQETLNTRADHQHASRSGGAAYPGIQNGRYLP